MKLDLPLMQKIASDLKELGRLVIEELYDKEVVLRKMRVLIADLDNLNTIKEEAFREYEKKRLQLYQNMQQTVESMDGLFSQLNKYQKWISKLSTYSPKNLTPGEFLKEGEKFTTLIHNPESFYVKIDNSLMNDVLNSYLHIHFTKQRKKALWWSSKMFRFRVFITTIIKLLAGCIIGIAAEEVLGTFVPSLPKLSITIAVTLILYFSIDKTFDRKYDEFFWKKMRIQVLKVYTQFNLYLEQINILIRSTERDSG